MGYKKLKHTYPTTSIIQLKAQLCDRNKTIPSKAYKDAIKRRLAGLVVCVQDEFQWNICGNAIQCTILAMDQAQCRIDRQDTVFEFDTSRQGLPLTEQERKDVHLTSLADMIESSFINSEAYTKLNIPVAKSILIRGVSGVGKTRLVKRVSELLSSVVYEISIHDLLSFSEEEYDLAEFISYNPLHLLVNKAMENTPAIVIIRDIDALTSATGEDRRKNIIKIMSNEMNRIGGGDTKPVCIVGLTRDLKLIPELLKKTDIFRQHMTLPIPSLPQRKLLLCQFLQHLDLQDPQVTIINTRDVIDYYATQISMRTSGYVARDLLQLIRQAQLKSIRQRSKPTKDLADQLQQQLNLSSATVSWSDFEYVLESYRPLQTIEVESILPKRDWNDLGGYQVIKDKMKQAILLPLLNPYVFTKLGIKPPSGLLLYGPSGCGKTALVQALVSDSMMNVISIKGPEIFSKYLGETENKIRKLFNTAKRISPCIIFIDEMDAIGTKRGLDISGGGGVNERVLSTLLNEMDGVESRQGVVVIGCTNRPDQIDDAILRPGRLDQLIHVGLPCLQDRIDIIKTLMKKVSVADDIDPIELAKQTEFCNGADLENLFREAGTAALRRDLNTKCINNDHVQSVIIPICERAEDEILQGKLNIYEEFLYDHTL